MLTPPHSNPGVQDGGDAFQGARAAAALAMDESLQKLLGRWSDRSLKGEKMHVRYDELNLEDFVNATKPL